MSDEYNASVSGKTVRVTKRTSGTTAAMFDVGAGATHAIMSGNEINVFYRKGGVKIYSLGGSMKSFTGDCS